MAKNLTAIVKEVRQFLRDEVSTETESFTTDELQQHIKETLVEISQAVPYIRTEVLPTMDESRVLDISSITDLLEIEKLEYKVGKNPRAYRGFIKIDDETIEIDTTITPDAGTSSTLTGTVTFTSGSAAVTGSGTAFSTELATTYLIKKSGGTRWYRILSITSDTALVLGEASHDNGADTEDATQYCSEPVILYCKKVHTLTDIASSLTPQLERLLVEGTTAHAATAWINKIRIEIEAALARVADVNTAVHDMSNHLSQAATDLDSGRAIIANSRATAITALGKMSAEIVLAIADLAAGRVIIADNKRQEALDSLAEMSVQLGQAIEDLTSGRAQIADLRDTADTAMDNASARITQAIDDLADGRGLINRVNVGGAPENDFATYGVRELQNAQGYLSQARTYLSQHTTADRYGNFAARDMQLALASINKARTFLALDQPAVEYAMNATRELQSANAYLGQARGYLAADAPGKDYAIFAGREVGTALGYLNQAGGFIREMSARLSTIKTMTAYQNWANQKYLLFRQDLRKIVVPRSSTRYPRD